jgi:drug/metabolite transporter (DMT)-like permease
LSLTPTSQSPAAERATPSPQQIARRQRQALLLALIGVLIFGLTLPATRMAVADFSPAFVMIGRALLAAALAALTLLWARPTPPRREDWPRLAWFALFSIIGFPLLMNTAMQYAPASHGAVVLAVLPLLTAMAGAAVAGERPSLGFWACGVAGTGAVFVYALLSGAGASQVHWADLLLAGAALCASMAYALGGELARRIGGWEVISWALVFSSPVMLVLLALFAWPINWDASLTAWAGFIYVSVFSMFLGFFAWNKGLAMGGIARISQMQLLQPFVGLLAAWALLGERIGWLEVAFAALVVALVALGWRMRVARTP